MAASGCDPAGSPHNPLVLQVSGQLYICCSSISAVVGIAEIYCIAIIHYHASSSALMEGVEVVTNNKVYTTSRRHQMSEGSVQPTVEQYLLLEVCEGVR